MKDLIDQVRSATVVLPRHIQVRHVKTGNEYMVTGLCFNESTMALCVTYSPRFIPEVVFCRPYDQFLSRFVPILTGVWK